MNPLALLRLGYGMTRGQYRRRIELVRGCARNGHDDLAKAMARQADELDKQALSYLEAIDALETT